MAMRWVIGLATRGSREGIDAALLEVEGCGLGMRARLLHALHQSLPEEIRKLTPPVLSELYDLRDMSLTHRLLGEAFAAVARQIADRATLSLQKVQCLGCSGNPIWSDS